jgi:hypothetical protein
MTPREISLVKVVLTRLAMTIDRQANYTGDEVQQLLVGAAAWFQQQKKAELKTNGD